MLSDSDPVVVNLLRWCSARGVQIDARIRVVRGEGGSICVLTRDAFIERRTTLVSIPKSAILSIRNCMLSEYIPKVIYGRDALLGLALGLYGELLRGSSSPWFGYLQSLPKRVSIPVFWVGSDEDEKVALEWIKGTMANIELSGLGVESTSDLAEGSGQTETGLLPYYESTALRALARVNLSDSATLDGFEHAYALVSSRSFLVDAYHGLAMVPIADAFNHSSENQVHLESDYEVCHTCGSLNECPHDAEDEGGYEHMAARAERTPGTLDGFENTCEMVSNASIPPYTEVFNTYGERLTNAQLLVRYGFLLDINENDVISWDVIQLSHFATSHIESSNEEGQEYIDEHYASRSSDLGCDVFDGPASEDAVRAVMFEHQGAIHSKANDGKAVLRKTDINREDSVLKISLGQILLGRLQEVLELWGCSDTTFMDSTLVYFGTNQETELDVDGYVEDASVRRRYRSAFDARSAIDGSNISARVHEESRNVASTQLKKHTQLYFALDDETRISHHLWILCVLLALHIGGAPRSKQLYEESQIGADAQSAVLATSVEEDVTVLQRALLVQGSLESLNLEPELSHSSEGRNPSWGVSSKSSAMSRETSSSPSAKWRARGALEVFEASSSSKVEVAQRRESDPKGLRKRARTSSTNSSTSCQSDGTRAQGRARKNRHVDEEFSLGTGEAFENTREDVDRNAFVTKFAAPEEPLSVARRQARKRDDGLLSALLRDYGDISDDATHSTCSEIENASAVGVGPREIGHEDGGNHPIDLDTRECPDQIPESKSLLPKKEHRYDRRVLAKTNTSFDIAAAPPGKSKLQDNPKKCDSEKFLSDVSVVRLVASTARVVSALCAARSSGMAYPNVGAAELGEMVDAIQPQMSKTRMAAELALGERVLLERCSAAWEAIERTASSFASNESIPEK